MTFEAWCAIVCYDDKHWIHPNGQTRLYALGWDAVACREFLNEWRHYYKKPKEKKSYRPKEYGKDFVERRMAQAIGKECARLDGRNLNSEGKAALATFQDYARKVAG